MDGVEFGINWNAYHADKISAANSRIQELEKALNRAVHPDKIWTDTVASWASGMWHCDLAPAPAPAPERWSAVRKAHSAGEGLYDRWFELEGELEKVRAEAVKKSAEAVKSGKKAPSMSAKVFDAETALEGCSMALRDAVRELSETRDHYNALWVDREFLETYRDSVVADFSEQREKAAETFKAAASHISELRRRYGTLHELTIVDLKAVPEEHVKYLPLKNNGWAHADVSTHVNTLSGLLESDDLIVSGDFLALPLDEITEAAEEIAEERKGTGQNSFAPAGSVTIR